MTALLGIAGGGGLWAYLGAKGKTKADLVTIAQDAAAKVIERFERIVAQQDARIAELEAQDERCRTELALLKATMATKPCAIGPCPVEDAA